MNEKHIKQWTDALRSGNYQQTRGTLHRLRKNATAHAGYCCLGVACDVAGLEESAIEGDSISTFLGHVALPPVELMLWAGTVADERPVSETIRVSFPDTLLDRDGAKYSDTINALDILNDHLSLSFDQIADLIDYFGVE